jgi:Flp pilus assembly protein TadG
MRHTLLPAKIRKFWRNGEAVAAVEFALILPLLLTLYLGTVEGAQLYAADRKVATVAGTVADLVSRAKLVVTEAQVDDYFVAATNIMKPSAIDTLGQIVSVISIDEDGVATVQWSEAYGAAEAYEEDAEYSLDPDSEISQLAQNSEGLLVVGEATYPYVPLTGFGLTSTVNLRHVEFFLPRRPGGIDLN